MNADGSSGFSNVMTVTVNVVVLVVPVAPTLNSISPAIDSDGTISLSWNSVSEATSYKVYRSKDGGSFSLIQTVSINSFSDIGLSDGSYRYKIKSKNDDGISGYSNIQSVTVQFPISPLNAPVLSIIIPSTDSDGSIDISWSWISDATSYELYRSKNNGVFILIQTVISTTYTDSNLVDGSYKYKVKTINVVGESSDFSNYQSVTVSLTGTPTPTPTSSTDYTMLYYLIPILGVMIGVIIYFKRKKSKGKRKK